MSAIIVAPIEVLSDQRLSDTERRVLLTLFSYRGKDTNTVWPSLHAISERSGIADVTRISKVTAALDKKGWLKKKKRGFTGCNQYTLSIPESLEAEKVVCNQDLMDEPMGSKARTNKIYLVTNGESCKIGITSQPMLGRLCDLQTAHHKPLEVLLCAEVEKNRELECLILDKYLDKKDSGEWMSLTETDILEIEYLVKLSKSGRFYSNLGQGSNLAESTKSTLAQDTKSTLAEYTNCKEQTIEQTIEQGKGKKTKKSSTSKELTLSAWLAVILEMGEKPIPDSDTILDYADDAGIPHDFLRLAWVEFKARYTEDQKKYKDWRAVFRRAVRGNWFKLWWHDGNSYILTSVGQQGMIALNNKKRSE